MATGPVVLPWVSFEAPQNCIWGHPSISLASLHVQPALNCVLYQILTELETAPSPNIEHFRQDNSLLCSPHPRTKLGFLHRFTYEGPEIASAGPVHSPRKTHAGGSLLQDRARHGGCQPSPARNSWIRRFATHTAGHQQLQKQRGRWPRAPSDPAISRMEATREKAKGRRVDEEGRTATYMCIFSY